MKVEEALVVLDKYLPQRGLNHLQELVFCASWQGQSYLECARTYGYSPEYIKAVGYKLWQLLSLAFKEPVTKKNFHSVLRRHSPVTQAELADIRVKSADDGLTPTNQSKVISQKAQKEALIVKTRQNWGEAVESGVFHGRAEELMAMEQWIVRDSLQDSSATLREGLRPARCRLIGVFGMGGIGKTALSCKLAKQIQGEFEYVFWKSLHKAPPIETLLSELIFFLSNQQETEADLPKDVEGRISRLIDYLCSSRCLVVLENLEVILRSGTYVGNYREGYEGYGELLRRVGEVQHQSVLFVTSREKPREFELLEGERLPVRSLKLFGLKQAEGQAIFEDKGSFLGSLNEWRWLLKYYGGNPLALKLAASGIQNLFDSNISEFINFLKQGTLVFDDIRDLLSSQFNRLSNLELSVMYWLAINREPVSLKELQDDFLSISAKQKLPEALRSLERRSLIKKSSLNFTLQPAVMQYAIERLISQACDEIAAEEITLLMSYALIKARAKNHVRESQNRLILVPIVEQLLTFSASHQDIESKSNRLLLKLQEKFPVLPGYGTQNLINLIHQIKTSWAKLDVFSLTVCPADIRNVNSHQVKYTQVNLATLILAESLVFSQKEKLLATERNNLDIRLWKVVDSQHLLNCRGHPVTVNY